MGRIEEKLIELGIELPEPRTPPPGVRFNFVDVTISGSIAYIAGHGPQAGSTGLMTGRLGDDLSTDDGYQAARLTGLAMLASLKRDLGDLDRVTRWLRAVGYVNAAPGFTEHAEVVNGFSDLIVEVWGDAGRHARSAPGAGTLPFNVPVIVEATVELA